MYNLLVTAVEGSWDTGFYEFDKSRYLEFTNEDITSALSDLSTLNIEKLKSYPCLFAYEGERDNVRVGYLTSIKEQGRNIRIEFEFDQEIGPIPFTDLRPIAALLDIRRWEMNRTHWAVKHEDLFERLKKIRIINTLKNERVVIRQNTASEKTSTSKATTVKGFIAKIFDMHKESDDEFFYRGHSNKVKYKLEPSIFRKDSKGNYLYKDSEHILYRELLVSNSADFEQDNYTLDQLVRMQHYSLPTRLLDITSNPLIALYFACKSSPDDEGEVITFTIDRQKIKYFDSDVASCIANLARLPKTEKEKILFDDEDFNTQAPVRRLIHFIREEKPFFEPNIVPEDLRRIICVKGKRTNVRISSQSGAFLLFGLDSVFDEEGTDEIKVSRITITNKRSILRELDLLNINESTVFPFIENSAKYVAERFKFSSHEQ